ncbi:endonuclease MutS2 [Synechococcus sp. PCC 7336]|uniref:endonuclease MutS2 n=1 Tax=Synechococcus sp. PCC 7336 TaxID=195250 RepID=UPI0003465E25|nr:endonuclease MutS2 [Synechococcus sp. PCC 7336]
MNAAAATLHPPDILVETLELLEWSRLCEHLASFAATRIGNSACRTITPWMSRQQSETLLAQTGEAIALDLSLPGGIPIQGICDLVPLLQRAELGGVLQGRELSDVANTLAGARKVRRVLDETEEAPLLQDAISSIRTYPEIERDINRCIDERGEVTDRASETLGNLRGNIRTLRNCVRDKLQNIMSAKSSAIQEMVVTERDSRFVIPIKASHRDVVKGLVHDSSASGATLYVEPNSVVSDNNQLRELQARERREEERILRQLSEQVGEVADDLRHLQAMLVLVDGAIARARYSLWLNAHPPSFDTDTLSLRTVRHPLLLWQSQKDSEQPFEVVPIDLAIAPEKRAVVITGPNTGGKTVTLKTLGLMVVMAKAGIFLPAREPVLLPWFDGVFADIGDEQSLQQSLSTFSGHIRRISRVLAAIDGDALVLLDEVGAGTDPSEGSALAAALLEHLAHTARLTVASTHYGELKALKYQDPMFENASVEFDSSSLAPTYRLMWGIPGRSHALAIALRLGLDEVVIDRAKARLGEDSFQVDTAIAGLEGQRAEQEEKLTHLNSLQAQLETLQQEMKERARQLDRREAELEAEKKAAIEQAIRSAQGEVASVIRRLQKQGATGRDAQAASEQLKRIGKQTQKRQPEPVVATEFYPEIGDRVRLRELDRVGELVAIEGGSFTVRSGILKFNVNLSQIEPLDEVQAKQRQRLQPVKTPKIPPSAADRGLQVRTSQNTLDIRGQRVADAEYQLDDWIANAASGAVWIIHGHGTGKLRAGVQEFLKRHPRVASFEAAEANDGGTGVTVAQIN